MKKITCVLAILAAASTAAVAKDLKQDNKANAPAVSATQMNDAEMDKVTAAGAPSLIGQGAFGTGYEASNHNSAHSDDGINTANSNANVPGAQGVGAGRLTAGH